MLSQPACDLISVDAAFASQARYRHIRPQAQCHQLAFRPLVIHAAPVALAPDHQSAFEIFQVFSHYVPTLVYVGT